MPEPPPDTLNEIGVLRRREIEARILAPVLEALGREFGREAVLRVAAEAIREIARQQGKGLADRCGAAGLPEFAAALEPWKRGDALRIEVLEQSPERFHFNVTGCRYADMYRALGIPELGEVLSCARDHALIEGFNPAIRLRRTQTRMQGAPFCDFRYRAEPALPGPNPPEEPAR